MANTHCAQCSDTRNIYIKTCDCSKQGVNRQIDSKPDSIKKQFTTNSSAVDQKKTEEPKLKAVKAIVYRVVRYVTNDLTHISLFPLYSNYFGINYSKNFFTYY